jgi:alcohol dehydrogenase class IV
MSRPELWKIGAVERLDPSTTRLTVTRSVRDRAASRFGYAFHAWGQELPSEVRTLVAIGGGTLLDTAKAFVHDAAPHVSLVAIPSIWGSGAEASPVVVLDREGKKDIRVDPAFFPAARAVWGELAATVPGDRARDACGDVWAHAVEGFLSPLASEALRQQIATIIEEMLVLPLAADERWFEISAAAASAQAQSSVGLVHGIAHTLEPLLADSGWGHAGLCATFLLPVLQFLLRSSKTAATFRAYGLEPNAVVEAAGALFDAERYESLRGRLAPEWPRVLRDRCTRTNSTLVRTGDVEHFLNFQ